MTPFHWTLQALPRTPATSEFTPDPENPSSLIDRRLPGEVVLQTAIDPAGHLSDIRILFASDPEFVQPALKAVPQWTFHSARQGFLAVEDVKRVSLTLFIDDPAGKRTARWD